MSSQSIRAGGAYVEATVLDKTEAGIRAIQAKLNGLSNTITKIGAAFTAAGGAIKASLVAIGGEFAANGSKLYLMSQRTGIAVESLSALSKLAKKSGTDLTGFESSIKRMQKSIVGAADDMGQGAAALAELGLSAEALKGLGAEEQFMRIAGQIAQIPDATERAGAALKIFGKSGTDLLPMFEQGGQAVRDFIDEAKRAGTVMSGEDAKSAKELQDSLAGVKGQFTALTNAIGAGAAPAIKAAADAFKGALAAVVRYVKEHRDLAGIAFKMTSVLAGVGASAAAVGVAMKVLPNVMLTITAGIRGVSAALMLIVANPVVATITALVAVLGFATNGFGLFGESAASATQRLAELRDAGDQQRADDQARMQRLEELAQKQNLTNLEFSEATALIKSLTDRYGDLGISIDATTGKITGVGEAQKKLNDLLRQQAIGQVKEEMAGLSKQSKEIAGRQSQEQKYSFGAFWGDALGFTNENDRRADERKQQAKLQQQYNIAKARLEALEAGAEEAIAGGKKPTAGAETDELAGKRDKILKEGAEAEKKLAELRRQDALDAMTEEERKIALIDEELAKKRQLLVAMREAEKVGRNRPDEIAGIERQFWSAGAEAETQKARVRREAHDKEIADRIKSEQELQAELARLEIEANLKGHEQKMALLQLEYDKALEKAELEGTDVGLVDKVFALKQQILDQQDNQTKNAAEGSFNARSADYFGGFDVKADTEKKQLDKLVAIAGDMAVIRRAAEKGGLQFV